MAWAAIIPAALSVLQEVMKQPNQGQTTQGGQKQGYQPTAGQFSQSSSPMLSDIIKPQGNGGVSGATVGGGYGPDSPGAGLGPIGGTPGQSSGAAQTAAAMGGQSDNAQRNLQQVGMTLMQLFNQQSPAGGLTRGPSSQYQPTALQQLQSQMAGQAQATNPYGLANLLPRPTNPYGGY